MSTSSDGTGTLPETTISARVVDGATRGALLGAAWGLVWVKPAGTSVARRRQILRSVSRHAIQFAPFLAIYEGVYCASAKIRGEVSGDPIPSIIAGAAAGTLLGLKTSTPARVAAATAAMCGVVSIAMGNMEFETNRT